MSANYNEAAYGSIADSYANKYGIPADMFRDVIRNTSDFDPMYSGKKGDGIAGLINKTGSEKINPYNVGQSLDFAAQYIATIYAETKDWAVATQTYESGNDAEIEANKAEVNEQLKKAQEEQESKSFWEYTSQDLKAFFSKSAWGLLFGIVGAILIIVSLYVVIAKGGDSGK